MNDTLQEALKELYTSMGGDIADVRNISDINTLIRAIATLDVASAISKAVELPETPENDGTYSLQVTIADGEATYSWEEVQTPEP